MKKVWCCCSRLPARLAGLSNFADWHFTAPAEITTRIHFRGHKCSCDHRGSSRGPRADHPCLKGNSVQFYKLCWWKIPSISYYNRQHARTFGTHADGRNESENKALKQFQINPRTKLSSIYYADSVRQTIRTISCDHRDNFVQHTIPLIDKKKKKELHIDTIEPLNQLNDYASHLAYNIIELSKSYYCLKIHSNEYHIKHRNDSTSFKYEVLNNATGAKISLSLPRFNRVRVVKVIQVGDFADAYKCNCNFTTQWGMPCRHVVFLKRQQLTLHQFDVCWLKVYYHPNW